MKRATTLTIAISTFPGILGFGLLPPGEARGQERPVEKTTGEPGRYFARPLDFWKSGLSTRPAGPAPRGSEEEGPAPPRVALRESIWAQPIRTPDGTWMITVPPRKVLDFLEDPTEETARAYLSWKRDQTEKLKKAMDLLARVKEPSAGAPAPESDTPAGTAETLPPSRNLPFRILYFKRPSCPHCVSQDAVLAEWLGRKPNGSLETVLAGDRPELWKAYGVRGTPTLVARVGSPGREEILVGLQSAEALDAALARLAPGKDGPPPEPRKEMAR